MDLSPKEEIYLKEYQIPHVEKLSDILTSNYCAFDMSMMGSGKTYTSSALALELLFTHVIIVCPASVESKWKDMKKYGVPIHSVISYDSLRSRKGSQPKHGLLTRIDAEDGSGVVFKPTELLTKLVTESTLIIFDEAQKFKNKNDQFYACKVLSESVWKIGGTSRFLLLSGTPIDKEEQAIHMLQMMGFIRSAKLFVYNKEERFLKLYGAQDLINYCNDINKEKTQEFLRYNPFYHDNVQKNCYLMFQRIIKPGITAAMPSPKLTIDCKNGYYKITSSENAEELESAIGALGKASFYNEKTGKVDFKQLAAGGFGAAGQKNAGYGAIQVALRRIELAKVNDMARIAKTQLESDPDCKVAICVTYVDSLKNLDALLKDYKPIIFNGQVQKQKRAALIEKFQRFDTEYRVFLGNIATMSSGIDLDDKDGSFPRYAYVSPNYNILDLQQLTRRFVRLDSRSNATLRFFYGKIGAKEMSIINALSRKSTVMKETTGEYTEDIKLPGEYTDEVEN